MSAHTGKGASAVEWSAIPGIVIVTSVGQGHRQPRARAATILAKDRSRPHGRRGRIPSSSDSWDRRVASVSIT